jgi:hypothetical protein
MIIILHKDKVFKEKFGLSCGKEEDGKTRIID